MIHKLCNYGIIGYQPKKEKEKAPKRLSKVNIKRKKDFLKFVVLYLPFYINFIW